MSRTTAEFQTTYGYLWPSASMVEKVFEDIEEGNFTALPLTEVINIEKG